MPDSKAVNLAAGQSLTTATVEEYEKSLTRLVTDFAYRRRLTMEKAMLRPALLAYRPDDMQATRIRLDFLVAEIGKHLCGFFNLKYTMDADQVGLTANMILESYGHEISASGFVVFSKTFIANRLAVGGVAHSYYDDLYSRLDGEVIAAGLRKYLGFQQQVREGLMRIDESFIETLPARIRIMTDAEIVALSKIGSLHTQTLIRSIISNWLNCGQHPGIPELDGYIYPAKF